MPAEEIIEVPTLYDRALSLSSLAHCRQIDKAGRPYIEHPMMVAKFTVEMLPLFESWRGVVMDPNRAAVLALLHDTVEDCAWMTEKILRDLFPGDMTEDVFTLSFLNQGRPGDNRREFRDAYLLAILDATSPYPLLVKAADLRHNTSPQRLQAVHDIISPGAASRLKRGYAQDVDFLGLRDSPFSVLFEHLSASDEASR